MLRSSIYLILLFLIGLAALAIGADAPTAALFFSAVIAGLTAAIYFFFPSKVGGFSFLGLIGAAILYFVAVVNGWVSTGAGEYASLAAAFGIYAVAQTAARDGRTAATLWHATIVVGTLLAGTSFIDFIVDPGSFWGLLEHPYGGGRFSGPFLSANTAATFYGVMAILSFAGLIRVARRLAETTSQSALEVFLKRGVVPSVGLMLSLTCIFLTASRAGITFLGGALLLLSIWELFHEVAGRRKLSLKFAGIGLASVFFILVTFVLSGGLYAERMASLGGGDGARELIFPAYFEAIELAPAFGHGLGGFAYVNSLIANAQNAPTIMFQGAAHNIILQWLLQGGVIGLGFVLLISFGWLRIMRQGLLRRSRQKGFMRAAVIVAFIVAAHGMFDYALEIPAFLFLFAWVCGLGAGVATGGSRTSGAAAWPKVAPLLNVGAAVILLASSCLALVAFIDRYDAGNIVAMDEEQFNERYGDGSGLSGSPTRLAAIGDRALRLQPPDASLAAQAFSLASEKEPRDGVLHARYAVARIAELGAVTPDAVAALSRSYMVMPYAPRELVDWRLNVVEGVWPYMPPLIREAAIREARGYNREGRVERLTVN